ncbi:MAG: hypothetical protein ABI822_13660 [Bryobacteraceae bacterium]
MHWFVRFRGGGGKSQGVAEVAFVPGAVAAEIVEAAGEFFGVGFGEADFVFEGVEPLQAPVGFGELGRVDGREVFGEFAGEAADFTSVFGLQDFGFCAQTVRAGVDAVGGEAGWGTGHVMRPRL